ncbi:hypothetical protein Pfo_011177 [Paulownia fortunei]|nr:hypothetical protein Pfo_011177 [Paulownia fortunei]
MMSNGNKLERKTIEKNRRTHMKGLCFKLVSLIPPQHFKPSKEFLSQLDQLEQAAAYIQQLTARVEELRRKTQALRRTGDATNDSPTKGPPIIISNLDLPVLKIRDLGSCLEVILISGLRKNFMLHQVISILEEEGAEVVTATLSNTDDKIFHTLHAQVKLARVGVETSRICGRLNELIS